MLDSFHEKRPFKIALHQTARLVYLTGLCPATKSQAVLPMSRSRPYASMTGQKVILPISCIAFFLAPMISLIDPWTTLIHEAAGVVQRGFTGASATDTCPAHR